MKLSEGEVPFRYDEASGLSLPVLAEVDAVDADDVSPLQRVLAFAHGS